jgi:serine/threonine protein kinase
MAEPIELGSLQTDISVHPALLAWRRLNREPANVGEISLLKKRFKSAIYRMEKLGPGAPSIVAKCCLREVAARERVIYDEILPKLPLTTPRYYGFAEGEAGYDWLFLEYSDGEQYDRDRQDHAALVGRWLALLHTSAARVAATVQLPELGPSYYFAQLGSALARLSSNLDRLNLPAEDFAVVRAVLQQCNFLESHWDQIDRWCGRMPRTLVHGDFKPRNVVIRNAGVERAVFAFDWEASGWGIPAEDLAYVDLAAYYSASKRSWPELSMQDLLRMKNLGRIFRGISEFCWESTKFNPEWEVSAVKLQYYRLRMAEAMANWEE